MKINEKLSTYLRKHFKQVSEGDQNSGINRCLNKTQQEQAYIGKINHIFTRPRSIAGGAGSHRRSADISKQADGLVSPGKHRFGMRTHQGTGYRGFFKPER